jgi:hypothetical protein
MRIVLVIAVLLLVAMSAAAVVSVAEPIRQYLSQATLALAILVLIGVVSQPRQTMPPRPNRPARRRNGLKRAMQTPKSSTSWRCCKRRGDWSIS